MAHPMVAEPYATLADQSAGLPDPPAPAEPPAEPDPGPDEPPVANGDAS
jgi:hypothetical protein